MKFRILDFYRLSDSGCPGFVGTTALDAAYHHVSWGWESTLICWYG